MAIKSIAYIGLLVEHWPFALQFYRDMVGLPVDQLFEGDEWVSFDIGGAKLAIFGGGIAVAHPKGADRNAFIPNIECDDIEGTIAELESRGVPFIAPLSDSGDGYKRATIVDPEGNRLQLFEWVGAGG